MAGSLALGSSASGVGNLTIQNGASLTTFSGTGFTGAGISIGNGTPSTAPATLTVNSGSTVNTGGVTVGGVINLGLGLNALNACPVILCHRLPSETVTLCSPRPS